MGLDPAMLAAILNEEEEPEPDDASEPHDEEDD